MWLDSFGSSTVKPRPERNEADYGDRVCSGCIVVIKVCRTRIFSHRRLTCVKTLRHIYTHWLLQ